MRTLCSTATPGPAINYSGIGFQRGPQTRRKLVANHGTGATTLTDMEAPFNIATDGVLTVALLCDSFERLWDPWSDGILLP